MRTLHLIYLIEIPMALTVRMISNLWLRLLLLWLLLLLLLLLCLLLLRLR